MKRVLAFFQIQMFHFFFNSFEKGKEFETMPQPSLDEFLLCSFLVSRHMPSLQSKYISWTLSLVLCGLSHPSGVNSGYKVLTPGGVPNSDLEYYYTRV